MIQHATIYKIINSEDGRTYIGSTCSPLSVRLTEHKSKSPHYSSPLYSAMNEHGHDSFRIEEIISVPVDCRDYWERRSIEDNDTRNPSKGYNVGLPGGSGYYQKRREELKTRARNRARRLAQLRTEVICLMNLTTAYQ